MTRSVSIPRALFDVTQFVSWPALSGIQRVLQHLAESWHGDAIDARYGFLEGDTYVSGPIRELGSLLASLFLTVGSRSTPDLDKRVEAVNERFHRASDRATSIANIEIEFQAYVLPEPTLRSDNLVVADRMRRSRTIQPFIIYYDALPLTHPEFYPRGSDGAGRVTRYHQVASRFENVAFISDATREVFETRIARRRVSNGVVAPLGADALPDWPCTAIDEANFTVVGTVEPKKRHHLIIEAFEELWRAGRNYELRILGAAGPQISEFRERLEHLSSTAPLRWSEHANDRDVSEALSRSSALIFVSETEGYGLPPLEALELGCPVIVPGNLPALEGLPSSGQVRLQSVTVETLCTAIEELADPVVNARYRSAIRDIRLPTWERFARDIEDWIAERLDAQRSRLVA